MTTKSSCGVGMVKTYRRVLSIVKVNIGLIRQLESPVVVTICRYVIIAQDNKQSSKHIACFNLQYLQFLQYSQQSMLESIDGDTAHSSKSYTCSRFFLFLSEFSHDVPLSVAPMF
jgi:hypothetical protein